MGGMLIAKAYLPSGPHIKEALQYMDLAIKLELVLVSFEKIQSFSMSCIVHYFGTQSWNLAFLSFLCSCFLLIQLRWSTFGIMSLTPLDVLSDSICTQRYLDLIKWPKTCRSRQPQPICNLLTSCTTLSQLEEMQLKTFKLQLTVGQFITFCPRSFAQYLTSLTSLSK